MEYFLKNILNYKNFYISTIDKKILVTKEIIDWIFGFDLQDELVEYNKLMITNFLFFEEDTFFKPFFELLKAITKENFIWFIKYLFNHNYSGKWDNKYKLFFLSKCKDIIDTNDEKDIYMQSPGYIKLKGKQYHFVPNFDALMNGVLDADNKIVGYEKKIKILHHQAPKELQNYIKQKTKEIFDLLKIDHGFEFSSNESNIFLQIADNFASIFNHLMKKNLITTNLKVKENFENNKWALENLGFCINKIGAVKNLNNFISIYDKAIVYSIIDLFSNNDCEPNYEYFIKAIQENKKFEQDDLFRRYEERLSLIKTFKNSKNSNMP